MYTNTNSHASNNSIQNKNNIQHVNFINEIDGGRYLDAIDYIPGLSHFEYRLILRFARDLNYKGDFREWRYCYHDFMAEKLNSNTKSVSRTFAKIVKMGWMIQRAATNEEKISLNKMINPPQFYCLSDKIFENYTLKKEAEFNNRKLRAVTIGYLQKEQSVTSSGNNQLPLAPSIKAPSIKAPSLVEEQPKTTTATFKGNNSNYSSKCKYGKLTVDFADMVGSIRGYRLENFQGDEILEAAISETKLSRNEIHAIVMQCYKKKIDYNLIFPSGRHDDIPSLIADFIFFLNRKDEVFTEPEHAASQLALKGESQSKSHNRPEVTIPLHKPIEIDKEPVKKAEPVLTLQEMSEKIQFEKERLAMERRDAQLKAQMESGKRLLLEREKKQKDMNEKRSNAQAKIAEYEARYPLTNSSEIMKTYARVG